MSEELNQGTVVRWGDLESPRYSPPIKAGVGILVDDGDSCLAKVLTERGFRHIYREDLKVAAESVGSLASRVTTLEQERDAAVEAEREACAALCETQTNYKGQALPGAKQAAAAIRARSAALSAHRAGEGEGGGDSE